ncbi:MAG: YceK/YidQ family lipoprotein [Desulfuromonadales bacterium]|nr:YceK/YidQ family lipoprotein [Desulfuromonadales bacterium]
MILLLFSFFGCATVIVRGGNTQITDGVRVTEGVEMVKLYPDTQYDAYIIKSDWSHSRIRIAPLGTIGGLLDMPFSLISDTLLLPYDIFKKDPHDTHEKPKDK